MQLGPCLLSRLQGRGGGCGRTTGAMPRPVQWKPGFLPPLLFGSSECEVGAPPEVLGCLQITCFYNHMGFCLLTSRVQFLFLSPPPAFTHICSFLYLDTILFYSKSKRCHSPISRICGSERADLEHRQFSTSDVDFRPSIQTLTIFYPRRGYCSLIQTPTIFYVRLRLVSIQTPTITTSDVDFCSSYYCCPNSPSPAHLSPS